MKKFEALEEIQKKKAEAMSVVLHFVSIEMQNSNNSNENGNDANTTVNEDEYVSLILFRKQRCVR